MKPWQITHVASSQGYIHVTGINHWNRSEPIAWSLNPYCFRDMKFAMKRYDFSGATWAEGAKEALAEAIRLARKLK